MTEQINEGTVLNDTKLLDMATKRVEEKNRLLIAFLDLVLLSLVFVFILGFLWQTSHQFLIAMLYLGFMGLRLVRKFSILTKDASTKGIRAYLQDRKDREIKFFYDKLLEAERVTEQ